MNIEDLVVFGDFLLEHGYILFKSNRYYSNYTKTFEKIAQNEIVFMNSLKFTKPYIGFKGIINNKHHGNYIIFDRKFAEIETLNFNELNLLIIEREKNLLEAVKHFYTFKNEKLWRNDLKKRNK